MLIIVSLIFLIFGLVEANQTSTSNGQTALSTLVRSKRQILYLCGQYPNQYYSNYPCYATGSSTCSNGGRKLRVGCINASQCIPYHRGVVTCLQGCCCTAPNPQPAPSRPNVSGGQVFKSVVTRRLGYCPNGQLSNVRCSSYNQCGQGLTCLNGLCCTRVSNEYTAACGGQYAISQCTIQRTCQSGLVCTAANYCCQCPVGRSGGRCNRGLCSAGYTCHPNGYCCASCPGNTTPYGACQNGQCGGGRRCSTGNICC